ncbi:U-scoloptoxin(16)-Ssd1a-like [Melitaea cinxia]|uniref:U-scoloptoxin(16)-Ssd1a-like n=1 Tax=Melitaea cinxia TaxID=113334 RepID=UPI001E26FF47|nr:U-scoloptoxin(16)-Ssd1a-like [Melitaea cinxia]
MIKLLVISACLCVAYAAVGIGPLEPKPEKFKDQEGCYVSDLDEVIPFGQAKPAKSSCMEYRCRSNSITYVTCGATDAVPPCKLVEDKGKPYPDCCKKIWCP